MKRWLISIIYLTILYSTLGIARDLVDYLRAHSLLAGTISIIAGLFVAAVCVLFWRSGLWQSKGRLAGALLSFLIVGTVAFQLEAWEERAHFIEYSVLALFIGWALTGSITGWRRFVWIVALSSLAGAIDEGIQYLLPSRYFDGRDIWFNSLAGTWGAFLHILVYRSSATAESFTSNAKGTRGHQRLPKRL